MQIKTKTLDDIQADMSDLYETLKIGEMELKKAGELANIAGKFLKAEQLKLAREIFLSQGRVTRAGDVAGHLAATVS
jgi:hypothetical protein